MELVLLLPNSSISSANAIITGIAASITLRCSGPHSLAGRLRSRLSHSAISTTNLSLSRIHSVQKGSVGSVINRLGTPPSIILVNSEGGVAGEINGARADAELHEMESHSLVGTVAAATKAPAR